MGDYPVFERHLGVWEGTYTLLDREGKKVDQHKSRLEITRTGNDYFQRNVYTWADGRQQSLEFPGVFRDGKLWFDTPRLKGEAVEVGNDIIVLTWHYKERPHNRLAEIIRLLDDKHRVRTWQLVEDDRFTKVMVIEEYKVADSV